MQDHYLTLGVGRTAGAAEIARAYRRLARRYHPDVSAAPAATLELFLSVQNAYETLADPRRRAAHDAELGRPKRVTAPPPVSVVGDAVGSARTPPAARAPEAPVQRPPLDARRSTTALTVAVMSVVALPLALLLAHMLPSGSRLLCVGAGSLLALIGGFFARSLAARQLEQLWRWTASSKSAVPRSARKARQRIQLADDVTVLVRRLVLFGVPIVFLLVGR